MLTQNSHGRSSRHLTTVISAARQLAFSPERERSTTSGFYSRREAEGSPEIPRQWQPGQTLPILPRAISHHQSQLQDDHPPAEINTVQSLLQTMQHSLESSLRGIEDRLGGLEERMGGIEDKQKEFQCSSSTPASSVGSPLICDNEKGRKRRSPPELQVCCT